MSYTLQECIDAMNAKEVKGVKQIVNKLIYQVDQNSKNS